MLRNYANGSKACNFCIIYEFVVYFDSEKDYRVTKNQVIQEYYYLISKKYIYFNFIGPRSIPNNSKPVIFTLFMNVSYTWT